MTGTERYGLRPRRVVVVGGTTYLGARLCEALLLRGDHVVAMDAPAACAAADTVRLQRTARFRLVRHEPEDPGPAPFGVDVVFHLAAAPEPAFIAPARRLTTATLGTLHALGIARHNNARLVLASLPSNAHRVDTDQALADGFRISHAVDAVLVRIGEFVGPGMDRDHHGAVVGLVRNAMVDPPLVVSSDGMRSHRVCDVDDVVAGLIAVADSRTEGPVLLEHPDPVSEVDLAMEIAAAAGTACRVVFARSNSDRHLRLASTPALDRLPCPEGWVPRVGVREALTRAVSSWSVPPIDAA